MNISIAIADANRNYLERFVEVLQEYEELSVSIFTNAELLEKALESKRYDIVLFDPDISEKNLTFFNVKLKICLYSEDAQNTALYADCVKVIKFQRISRIYKEIIKAYADKAGYLADFDSDKVTNVVGVYSPIGGSGKTTMALSIACKLLTYGKEVLFLSMEQLDSTSCVNVHTEDADGITVLLESMGESINFELKIKGLVKKGLNGISYIEGFERFVDYNTVTKEEIEELIEKIRRCGICDVLIIDMESRIDSIGQTVFEKADCIVVVEKAGDVAIRKMNMFAKQALTCEHKSKMCTVINFADNNVGQGDQLDVPNIGSVPNVGNRALRDVVQLIASKDILNLSNILK